MQQFVAAEIGQRIAQARKEKGMTQDDLAALCSFSKRSLQDYEAGTTVPYRHLRELGQILGRSPQWFLYGEEESDRTGMELLEAVVDRFEKIADRMEGSLDDAQDDQR